MVAKLSLRERDAVEQYYECPDGLAHEVVWLTDNCGLYDAIDTKQGLFDFLG